MGLESIDFDAIEITDDFQNEVIPAGKYLCKLESAVDEADRVSKSGGTYSRVKLTFRILDGDHANKCIFHDAIYQFDSMEENKQKAAKIGCQFLKKLVKAGNCASYTPEGFLTAGNLTVKTKVKSGGLKDASTGEKYDDKAVVVEVTAAAKKTPATDTEAPF